MGCGASSRRIAALLAYEAPSGGYPQEDDDTASGIAFLHDNAAATAFLARFTFKRAIVDPGLSPGQVTRAMEGDCGGEEYHSDTVVWLATDKGSVPPMLVAVKVVRIRSRAFLRQFRKECKTMQKATKKQRRGGGSRLALATFVAAARTPHNTLIASEFVGGGELFDLIAARGALPDAWAARMAGQLLSAFAMLHPLNVIHFDLKPENVLLAQDAGARADEARPHMTHQQPAHPNFHVESVRINIPVFYWHTPPLYLDGSLSAIIFISLRAIRTARPTWC